MSKIFLFFFILACSSSLVFSEDGDSTSSSSSEESSGNSTEVDTPSNDYSQELMDLIVVSPFIFMRAVSSRDLRSLLDTMLNDVMHGAISTVIDDLIDYGNVEKDAILRKNR